MEFSERSLIPLCSGVHEALEAEADRLLHESLRGVTSHSAKSDILTTWKEWSRRNREVYMVREGLHDHDPPRAWDVIPFGPDRAIRRGFYWRSINPGMLHLNSTYRVASVMARHRGVTMWDLRTSWPIEFPVKISQEPKFDYWEQDYE